MAVIVVNVPAAGVTTPTAPFNEPETVALPPTVKVVTVIAGPLQAVLKLIVPVTEVFPLIVRAVPVRAAKVPAAATVPPMAGGLAR